MDNNKNKRTNPNQVNIDDVKYQSLKERTISKNRKIHLDFSNVSENPKIEKQSVKTLINKDNGIYIDIKKEMEYQAIRDMLKTFNIHKECTKEELEYIRNCAKSLNDDNDNNEDLSKNPQFIEDMAQLKQEIMKDIMVNEVKESIRNELRIEFDSKFKELRKDLAINYNNHITQFKDNYVKEMAKGIK